VTSPLHAEAEEELARCITRLLMHEPFFGHLLGNVVRGVSDEIPTAAVGAIGDVVHLWVNAAFFMHELKSREERIAVVKHEALHLLFKHIHRPPPGVEHKQLWNIACDLVVNQYVGEPWDLPESAITIERFEELGLELEAERSVEYYFDALRQPEDAAAAEATAKVVVELDAQGSHSDHSRWDDGPPEDGGGAERDGEARARVAASLVVPASQLPAGLAQALAVVRARVGEAGLGELPGGLRELMGVKSKAALDWKRVLRIFANHGDRTRIASTTRRESRRFSTVPGIKVKRLRDLVVAIDTSGSVSEETLAAVFGEIRRLWRAGADVEVVACDTEVRQTLSYRGRRPAHIEGGGGTAFDPVFRWLRQRRTRPDGCIYITDGFGPTPKVSPRCRLLWLVTAGGDPRALRFGQVARLPFG